MLTLNQIKNSLVEYFQEHGQVNDVKYQGDFDFAAERNLVYPVVNISFTNSSIREKMLDYNFKIVIGDLIDAETPEQEDEVISDAHLIAEDFFSFLQVQEGWVFSKSSRINPFSDDTGDRVSGIVFTITLSVVRSQNECVKPTR